MLVLPPLPVWKGLAGSTTSAWILLHLFLAVAPRFGPGSDPLVVFLPISILVVLCAAAASLLDLVTHRERILYENLGVGPWNVYGAAVIWTAALEAALGLLVVAAGSGSGL